MTKVRARARERATARTATSLRTLRKRARAMARALTGARTATSLGVLVVRASGSYSHRGVTRRIHAAYENIANAFEAVAKAFQVSLNAALVIITKHSKKLVVSGVHKSLISYSGI